jgi:hypothetical protein
MRNPVIREEDCPCRMTGEGEAGLGQIERRLGHCGAECSVRKRASVGAGAGAAAGTAATGTEEVVLQAESAITFTTPPTAAKESS